MNTRDESAIQRGVQASNSSAVAVVGKAKALANPAVLSVPVRRIAVFHTNGLDDLLFSLPALNALRESFPGAVITSVLRPSLAALLREVPFVDEVLHRPKGGLSAQATLMARLHAAHYDMALVFSQSRNMTLLAWSTGAGVRAGFDGAKMEALLTHRVPKSGASRLEWHLDLVREIGCKTHALHYGGLLEVGAQAHQHARRLLENANMESPFVLVAPSVGSKRNTSQWPAGIWRETVRELSTRWPIVVAGGTWSEGDLASENKNASNGNLPRVLDVCGQTDLPTLAALCAQASVVIATEGGLPHLAAAMQTPVVALSLGREWKSDLPRGVHQRILNPDGTTESQHIAQSTRELIGI